MLYHAEACLIYLFVFVYTIILLLYFVIVYISFIVVIIVIVYISFIVVIIVIVYISFIVVIIVKGDTKLGHQYRSHEVVMVYIAEDVMDYTGFTTLLIGWNFHPIRRTWQTWGYTNVT